MRFELQDHMRARYEMFGPLGDALAAYANLAALDDVAVAGSPAEIVAAYQPPPPIVKHYRVMGRRVW